MTENRMASFSFASNPWFVSNDLFTLICPMWLNVQHIGQIVIHASDIFFYICGTTYHLSLYSHFREMGAPTMIISNISKQL